MATETTRDRAGAGPERRSALADLLDVHRDALVAAWIERVQREVAPSPRTHAELRDAIDQHLLELQAALRRRSPSGRGARASAREHGRQRFRIGFDLGALVREYGILRGCVFDLVEQVVPQVEVAEVRAMTEFFAEGVAHGVAAFVAARDEELRAAERATELAERELERSKARIGRRERAMDAAASAFARSTTFDELLPNLLREIAERLDWDLGAVWRWDPERRGLTAWARWSREGVSAPSLEAATSTSVFSPEVGLPGRTWSSGRPVWIGDVAADLDLPRRDAALEDGMRGALAFPVRAGDATLAVVELFRRAPREDEDDAMQVTAAVAGQLDEFTRRLAEQEVVRRSEAQKSAILSVAVDCIISMNAAGRVVAWNPAAARTFGWSDVEAIGRPLADLIVPVRLREAHARGIARYLATREGRLLDRRIEMPALCRDGSEILVELIITRVPDEEPPWFTATIRDITEAKRAEARQRLLLRASEILARLLDVETTMRSLAQQIVPTIADWCVIEIPGDEHGDDTLVVHHTDPAKVEALAQLHRRYRAGSDVAHGSPRVLRTGEAELHTEVREDQLAAEARDEEHRELLRAIGPRSAMIVPVIARGRTIGVVTLGSYESVRRYDEKDLDLARELATRAGLAIESARLYEAAQRAIAIREDILAIVSHDLRNPLGALSMAASLLAARIALTEPESPSRKQIEIIQRAARRMERLIGDLLDMAGIQAGRLAIEKKLEDPQEVLAEALDLHDALAREKGLRLVRELALEGPHLACDRGRVHQVLANLLGNAIKFCSAGDTITVRGRRTAGEIEIEIADTGPGIAPTELPHVFEPYWSARRHARRGTGLGLYIARGIVEAHGGRIRAESELGVGSTFIISLPAS